MAKTLAGGYATLDPTPPPDTDLFDFLRARYADSLKGKEGKDAEPTADGLTAFCQAFFLDRKNHPRTYSMATGGLTVLIPSADGLGSRSLVLRFHAAQAGGNMDNGPYADTMAKVN